MLAVPLFLARKLLIGFRKNRAWEIGGTVVRQYQRFGGIGEFRQLFARVSKAKCSRQISESAAPPCTDVWFLYPCELLQKLKNRSVIKRLATDPA